LIDEFIAELELATLRKMMEQERTSAHAIFLAAQSQMWMFAVYEVLRAWRERAKDVLKLHANGGLGFGAKKVGFRHVGREMRAEQLRRVVNNMGSKIWRLHARNRFDAGLRSVNFVHE
jgi:hypothetical protein